MAIPIEAEIGVRRLHALCADAVWRKDGASFANCYAKDAVWKIAGQELRGRDAIASALAAFGTENERVLMVFGAPILALQNGKLTGRTYVIEHVKRFDGGASASIGIYYERFVENDGAWLFQWRHFDFCYFGKADLSDPFYPAQDYGPPPSFPTAATATAGLHVQT